MKHYVKTPVKGNGKKITHYTTQCGQTTTWDKVMKANSIAKVTCPECILALLTTYETKICMLEERCNTLFPNRPVGEKLQ